MKKIQIIETPIFTNDIDKLLSVEEFRKLQLELVFLPEKGNLIKGAGGARKLRFGVSGKGKSGGIRIIYYYKHAERIYLLLAYKKAKQEELTMQQKKSLKSLIERIK